MTRSILKFALAAATIGAITAGTAYADQIELQLSSGADTYGTLIGESNTVEYTNTNFNGWDISLVFAESNSPTLTPYGLDVQDLTATCIGGPCASGGTANNLVIAASDIDFTVTVPANGFINSFSNTGTGSLSQSAYGGNSNLYFDESNLISTINLTNTSATVSASGGGPAGPSPYSLTLVDTLDATGGLLSYSSDGQITTVPEPATLALFGAALLGFALCLGRRRSPNTL